MSFTKKNGKNKTKTRKIIGGFKKVNCILQVIISLATVINLLIILKCGIKDTLM